MSEKLPHVWTLGTELGADGEWSLLGVYSTLALAEEAQAIHQRLRTRTDGTTYRWVAEIDCWDFDEMPE
jgi:hypothetical protein